MLPAEQIRRGIDTNDGGLVLQTGEQCSKCLPGEVLRKEMIVGYNVALLQPQKLIAVYFIDSFSPVIYMKFLVNIMQMFFYRADRHIELNRDLLIQMTLRKQL